MITYKVTYTIESKYIDQNKQRIKDFLKDFKKLDNSQFLYSIFQSTDENTFIHLSQYKNEDIQQTILNIPSFITFQNQRDIHLISEPVIEVLHFFDASKLVI